MKSTVDIFQTKVLCLYGGLEILNVGSHREIVSRYRKTMHHNELSSTKVVAKDCAANTDVQSEYVSKRARYN